MCGKLFLQARVQISIPGKKVAADNDIKRGEVLSCLLSACGKLASTLRDNRIVLSSFKFECKRYITDMKYYNFITLAIFD